MRFTFRSFVAADADAILTWHYDPPYEEYDPAHDPSDVEETLAAVGSPTWFAADAEDGSRAGFLICRIGEGEVEVGLGLRPDLTGRGFGPSFTEAIVELIRARWAPRTVTLDVLPWNERAIRAYERAGFVRGEPYDRVFDDGTVRTFVRMTRTLTSSGTPGLDGLRSMLDAPSPAVLVTSGGDGSAHVSPVWFRYTGDAFEVVVAKTDRKRRHLERDPHAELMVFETVVPFRGVKIRAEVELDDANVDDVRRAIAARYLGPEAGRVFVAERGPGVVIRFPASATRAWDLSAIMPVTTGGDA